MCVSHVILEGDLSFILPAILCFLVNRVNSEVIVN